jgi:hypothetical protein
MKIPVFLPVTREFGFRDEFAQDCLLQQRVCKPSVPQRGADILPIKQPVKAALDKASAPLPDGLRGHLLAHWPCCSAQLHSPTRYPGQAGISVVLDNLR